MSRSGKNRLDFSITETAASGRAEIVRTMENEVKGQREESAPIPFYEDFDVEDKEILDNKTALDTICSKKFANEIKIDFIKSIDYRIMCRFLGLDSVPEIKNYPYRGLAMIVNLLEQVLPDYMKEEGYAFAGELNFDRDGNSIPVEKKVWKIRDKEVIFNISGFAYYEKIGGKRKDNVVFLSFYDAEHEQYLLSCYSSDDIKSEQIVNKLELYAKAHNCLRGAKLRDIDIHYSTFSIVNSDSKYTWEKYYYPKGIKELFSNEVFGFLDNTGKYNKFGITKRGILMWGAPGCVVKGTKIVVRKKSKEGKHEIINK
jgi:hypothetical protein